MTEHKEDNNAITTRLRTDQPSIRSGLEYWITDYSILNHEVLR